MRQLLESFKGYKVWKRIKRKYEIDYDKVLIILPEDNEQWNSCAVNRLPFFMRRRNVSQAVILSPYLETCPKVFDNSSYHFINGILSADDCRLLMRYYCLYNFFDNIVFFYLNFPKDNQGTLILNQGKVSMDELICLGFYHLRGVPTDV